MARTDWQTGEQFTAADMNNLGTEVNELGTSHTVYVAQGGWASVGRPANAPTDFGVMWLAHETPPPDAPLAPNDLIVNISGVEW